MAIYFWVFLFAGGATRVVLTSEHCVELHWGGNSFVVCRYSQLLYKRQAIDCQHCRHQPKQLERCLYVSTTRIDCFVNVCNFSMNFWCMVTLIYKVYKLLQLMHGLNFKCIFFSWTVLVWERCLKRECTPYTNAHAIDIGIIFFNLFHLIVDVSELYAITKDKFSLQSIFLREMPRKGRPQNTMTIMIFLMQRFYHPVIDVSVRKIDYSFFYSMWVVR